MLSALITAVLVTSAQAATYTVSASALKAKVKAEADKVEKYRQAAQGQSIADLHQEGEAMTTAQRLEDMASLIGQESATSGTDMIKVLDTEARESLASLQQMWISHTVTLLDKIGQWDTNKDKRAHVDPAAAKRNHDSLAEIGMITAPFQSHLEKLEAKHPALSPFTKKIGQFSSFFQEKTLQELMSTNLPQLIEFKQQSFANYTPQHKAQIEDVCDMIGATDLLTVLRDPTL